jgi:hypothetical protein
MIDKTARSAPCSFEPMLDRAIPLLPPGKELRLSLSLMQRRLSLMTRFNSLISPN